MKTKISVLSIISLVVSMVAFGLYMLLLSGTDVYILWSIIGTISIFSPILSKYIRIKKNKTGKAVEIVALILGVFNFNLVYSMVARIEIVMIYNYTLVDSAIFIISIIICVIYAKAFDNLLRAQRNSALTEDWLKKAAANTSVSTEKRCPHCGERVNSTKCEMCGKEITC